MSYLNLMMLAGCFLGVGFMVLFFVSLTRDERKIYTANTGSTSLPSVRSGTERPKTVVKSPALLAIGVVRVTTALASNSTGTNGCTAMARPHVVTLDKPAREIDFTRERRYHLG
jgi:hypothetical protein